MAVGCWLLDLCFFFCLLQGWSEIKDVKESNLAVGMGKESNDGMVEY